MKFASLFSGLLVTFPVLAGAETLRKMEEGDITEEGIPEGETFRPGYPGYYPPPQQQYPPYPQSPGYPQCASRYFKDKKLVFEFEVTDGVVLDASSPGNALVNPEEVGDRVITHDDVKVLIEKSSYGGYGGYRPSYPPHYETGPTVGTISLVSTAVSCSSYGSTVCEVLLNGVIRFDDYYFCKGSISFSAAHTFPAAPTVTAAAVSKMPMAMPGDPIYGPVTGGNKAFAGANGEFEIEFLRSEGDGCPSGGRRTTEEGRRALSTVWPTPGTTPSGDCQAFLKITIHPFAPSKGY